jgi:hypothetical protein
LVVGGPLRWDSLPSTSDLPPESHRLDGDHHPTPFSSQEIRDASGAGTTVTFRIEPLGEDAYLDRWEFLGGDDDDGRRRRWTETLDGDAIEPVSEVVSSWLDLQRHASYPCATTRLMTGSATTPAGEYECWIYVTTNDDGTVTKAYFARTEPGPPVLMETVSDGEIIFRMALVGVDRV